MDKPFLQSEPTTFKKLYPQVKSLKLVGKEYGDFSSFSSIPHSAKSSIHFNEFSLPVKMQCSNPKCQQGGYKLEWIIDSLIRGNEVNHPKIFHCQGHEGTPKGRKIGEPCCNYIDISVEIEYEKNT